MTDIYVPIDTLTLRKYLSAIAFVRQTEGNLKDSGIKIDDREVLAIIKKNLNACLNEFDNLERERKTSKEMFREASPKHQINSGTIRQDTSL
jgi:predicted component of type VI protein secretion system